MKASKIDTRDEITRSRTDPSRYDVVVGGEFKGYLIKDATTGVWSAYGNANRGLLGYAKARRPVLR